nr:pilus assembly protein TadG-related protein [Cryobacterium roopkundense]
MLTIFYGFLSLVLILVVVAATSLYLERKRLFTLADGAALAGSEAFEFGTVGREPSDVDRALNQADVGAAVTEYLALPHESFEGLSVDDAFSADGHSATVTLSAWWSPPVLTLVIPSGLPVTVTAVARSVMW